MSRPTRILFSLVNRLGNALPKRLQRRIADFPGVLKVFEKVSQRELAEFRTPEGQSLVINPLFHSSMVVTGNLGDYERGVRNAIVKLAKPGMTAYDIGANVGVFSFLFSSLVGQNGSVCSFEPEPNNIACFEKSLAINNPGNITLDRRAVAKDKGTEQFDRRGGAFSGRLTDGNTLYASTDNTFTVETVGVDHLVEHEGYPPPDLLKIDVEGNEEMVFEGMRNLLRTKSPIIICELHDHIGDARDRVIDLLRSNGYTFSDLDQLTDDDGHIVEAADMSKVRHIVALKAPAQHDAPGTAPIA